jgi:hypothetical protein
MRWLCQVRLEGVEDILISHCVFQRLDSNAISINGYSRRASVTRNEFVWLGQNAITSWGKARMQSRNHAIVHAILSWGAARLIMQSRNHARVSSCGYHLMLLTAWRALT